MSDVNIPLLRKAVEWAEAEAAKPKSECQWEQKYYVLPVPDETNLMGWYNAETVKQTRQALGRSDDCGTCYCIAGYIAHVSGREFTYATAEPIALEELGLTNDHNLFLASNSITTVREIAERIAGEKL